MHPTTPFRNFTAGLIILAGLTIPSAAQQSAQQIGNTTPAAAANVTTAHSRPRTDAHGNPLRYAATGHVSNYDEAKVGTYTLPDPLVLLNGQPVRDADTWYRLRRPEILNLYATEIYGRVPANAPAVTWQVVSSAPAFNGTVTLQQIDGRIGDQPGGPVMHLSLYLPAHAPGPVPVIFNLIFGPFPTRPAAANSTASTTPATPSSQLETPNSKLGTAPAPVPPRPRGPAPNPVPIAEMLGRGYGYASLVYTDIQPDARASTQPGVIALTQAPGTTPAPDAWGGISAWAWGASRVLDYLATNPAVDATRVALVGHSRLGKTVLWAGAQDPRWALVYSSCAGEMGSSLARRDYGETVDDMAAGFPWQFAGNFQKYAGHWNDLPVDTNLIIALNAPHPLFITGGTQDQWADPHGEFLGEVAAGPVYRLVGKQDLGTTTWPAPDVPVTTGDLAYYYHTGPHAITTADWKVFLPFADRYLHPVPPAPAPATASAPTH